MISDATVVATVPVSDLDDSIAFYRDRLGLTVNRLQYTGYVSCQTSSGSTFFLFQRKSPKQDHTVIAFLVDDLVSTLEDLKSNNIEPVEIDEVEIHTNDQGIAAVGGSMSAWIRDPDENLIAITQLSSTDMDMVNQEMATSSMSSSSTSSSQSGYQESQRTDYPE